MKEQRGRQILAINVGSATLKAALYDFDRDSALLFRGTVDRIGSALGTAKIIGGDGRILFHRETRFHHHDDALTVLFEWLTQRSGDYTPDAIGHRIVHGGVRYSSPQWITPELIAALQELVRIDPEHLPLTISGIRFSELFYPDLPQVACFDTAFHRSMPQVAQRYALPRAYSDDGLIRFGFHGLSCEYIMEELRAGGGDEARGRVIVAHLGSGASMTAIRDGQSVDTTMGFTPTEGLLMSTRSGDLDPGIVLELIDGRKMQPETVSTLLNRQSGLLGVSGVSEHMLDLLAAEPRDPRAAEAIALFCYRAKKYVGALAAALDGLDLLVFTGGIGEHAPSIRDRICSGLDFLGIRLDPARNRSNASVISSDGSAVKVRVMKTNEEAMIARHTARLIEP